MVKRTLANIVTAGAIGDAIGYPLELLTVPQIREIWFLWLACSDFP